jgi:hypothetical protein
MGIEDSASYCAYKMSQEPKYRNIVDSKIVEDTIFYILLGYNLDMNTLLSNERANFLNQSGMFEDVFSKILLVEQVDKEVLQYYQKLNSKLEGNFYRIEVPLFIDYITDEASCFHDALDKALELRESKKVKRLRKMLDAFGDAQDSVEVAKYRKAISEIVTYFTEFNCKTRKIEISISKTPSISFGLNLISPGVIRKMINMNFMVDLAKFALRGK